MYIQPQEPLKQEEKKVIHKCMNCDGDSGKCMSGAGNPCKVGCPKYCGDCNTEKKREVVNVNK